MSSHVQGFPSELLKTPPFTAENWPIGAAMMAFANGTASSANGALPADYRLDLMEAAHAGFDHIDLTDNWVEVANLTEGNVARLEEGLAHEGLGISAISVTRKSIIDPDPKAAEANFDYSVRTLEAAAKLGVKVVCLGLHRPLEQAQLDAQWFWHAPGATDDDSAQTRKKAADGFRQLGERAGELGVEISLEMYEDTLLGTSESSVDLITAIDLPNVGLNPDIGNIVRLHRPVEDWRTMVANMAPYTNYWHMKNYFRDEDPVSGGYFTAPAPMDAGFINYREAVGVMLESGFSGPICVEHYGGDGLSMTAQNRDYLRRILDIKLRRQA